ncbi:MAG TPA: hypothetical protein VHC48_02135 [Puia sp.]|nr:hypothetical protein [Puia sp.]
MQKILFVLTMAMIYFPPAIHAQATASTILNINSLMTERAGVKATREFWKMNGEGKGERWYKFPGGYLAEFEEGAIRNKMVFDRRGNWAYSMREYTEKELPREVRNLVKSTFYDFNIGWVKEVTQNQVLVYVVHIDNAPEWKDLIVRDGEIEVSHEVTK